ncbi:hypothetical protein B0H12DRAFT_1164169 [Mycena haematopus]|nr:hypothetical protein B0H12DRAFT_1164169 [Mycena haematopus]
MKLKDTNQEDVQRSISKALMLQASHCALSRDMQNPLKLNRSWMVSSLTHLLREISQRMKVHLQLKPRIQHHFQLHLLPVPLLLLLRLFLGLVLHQFFQIRLMNKMLPPCP